MLVSLRYFAIDLTLELQCKTLRYVTHHEQIVRQEDDMNKTDYFTVKSNVR